MNNTRLEADYLYLDCKLVAFAHIIMVYNLERIHPEIHTTHTLDNLV